jgi:hypothetical protein
MVISGDIFSKNRVPTAIIKVPKMLRPFYLYIGIEKLRWNLRVFCTDWCTIGLVGI